MSLLLIKSIQMKSSYIQLQAVIIHINFLMLLVESFLLMNLSI